jgi:hypothetical protein
MFATVAASFLSKLGSSAILTICSMIFALLLALDGVAYCVAGAAADDDDAAVSWPLVGFAFALACTAAGAVDADAGAV